MNYGVKCLFLNILYKFWTCFYVADSFLLGKLSLTQASGSINMYEKSEQNQNDISVNASLHNKNPYCDSLFDASHDQVLKYEPQLLDIKPDLNLLLKQEMTPGLGFKSELPASTLNLSQNDQLYLDHKAILSTHPQEYQADISMTFSNKYNG